jgi:hypothetical protein
MNLFHELLIEDILDMLMGQLDPINAYCLARTCWAEWDRRDRLCLSVYPLGKTLRRLARAGILSQFQYLCQDWRVPGLTAVRLAQHTSSVPFWEGVAGAEEPKNLLDKLAGNMYHAHHSWPLYQHYSLPTGGSVDTIFENIVADLSPNRAQADFLTHVATWPLMEADSEQYLAVYAVRNRFFNQLEIILNRDAQRPEGEWSFLFEEAVENHNIQALAYMIENQKIDVTRSFYSIIVFRYPFSSMQRMLDTFAYLVSQGIPLPKDLVWEYMNTVAVRREHLHEPYNPWVARRLFDMGMVPPEGHDHLRECSEVCHWVYSVWQEYK